MTRVIFMGTPDFAVPALRVLCAATTVVGVYTQPDRPSGRGRKVEASPVKREAEARGFAVFQPKSLRPAAIVEALRALQPDLIVVAAYGLILPQSVLDIPPLHCINIHASLLPKYRGASPITHAILNGERETGITLMQMEAGLDTGPIIAQRTVPIDTADTTGALEARLSVTGAELLAQTLPAWIARTITPVPQDHAAATLTRLINKADGLIDWSAPAAQIALKVRAYTPWPGAVTTWNGETIKIVRAAAAAERGEPGRVTVRGGSVLVGTGEGSLRLHVVQPAGKRAMDAESFVRGRPQFAGASLGGAA
ncbi:MAG: methionyl-tRNA formyltransferase [Chloroflexi bacterium]|nr:methionyl-tRNA formyltransferase [Chloroflexota bacterium]